MRKIAKNPLFQLIFAMLLVSCYHEALSNEAIRFFLTISTWLKELLIFVLPFLLFSFLATALSSIPRAEMPFVLMLMCVVFISNIMNVFVSGAFGFLLLSDITAKEVVSNGVFIEPFVTLGLPEIVTTTQALVAGLIVGFANAFFPNKYVGAVINSLREYVMIFMKKFFVPLLPLFVSGFLLKLFAEGRMTGFVKTNSYICLMMFGFLLFYLSLWLLVAAKFRKNRVIEILKNTLPAIITAFSTMSSAAALPLSLNAAEKNTRDKSLAGTVMPLTLNFHMVGDTIIVPILAMIVMLAFNHPLPDFKNFMMFGVFFILNKFAGGGVPSGTIMVTVPVLKSYLGFDDSMIAFAVAFYGVVDPVATAGNVTANNFFVIIFQTIKNFVKKRNARKPIDSNANSSPTNLH